MQSLATVHPNPDPHIAQLSGCRLHCYGRLDGLEPLVVVRVGAAEDGEHSVADVLVDGAVVLEDDRDEAREELVQHPHHVGRIELFAESSEAAHVGHQNGHRLNPLSAQPGRCSELDEPVGDLGRELTHQARSQRSRSQHLEL